MKPMYEDDIEDIGDLFLDVAEAYMDKGQYKLAKSILEKLVGTTNYNLVGYTTKTSWHYWL